MGSSIENLPVELLVDILLKSQSPRTIEGKSHFENVTEECQRPVSNWVPFMLVCHLFRDVILGAGNLWSRLPVTNNLIALQHRLLRSQDSLVDLLFGGSWEYALPLIIAHASRVRAVITTPRFHINSLPSLVQFFHVPLPTLERVYVVPQMNLDSDSQDWLKLREVGSILNETSHPRVKAITSPQLLLPPKESCFWSWRLLRLDIRSEYDYITPEERGDISAVLRTIPGLVSLAITFSKYALPPDYLDQMTGDPPISYPIHPRRAPASLLRLRMLTLDGPAWLCGPVLHDIDTPSLVNLYVQTRAFPRPDTGDTITAMFPERLCRILARFTRLYIRAAPFDKHGFRIGDCHCHCEAGDSGVGNCHCEGGRVPSDMLYLGVQDDSALYSASEVLCRVFKGARLETLEVSYFERQGGNLYAVWRFVLETFPGLRKVMLYFNDRKSGGAMVNAIEALQREGLNPEMELIAEHTSW